VSLGDQFDIFMEVWVPTPVHSAFPEVHPPRTEAPFHSYLCHL